MGAPAGAAFHLISPDDLRVLATGGGDGRVVSDFWQSERSWRLLGLRGLVRACAELPGATGPLLSLDIAYDLLVRAERADPAVTEDVLVQPQVGIWIARTVGQMRAPGDVPHWADLGYFHALAVAAAHRTRLTFELDIPVRFGVAVLPTVGAAAFPAEIDHVRVRGEAGRLTLAAGELSMHAERDDPRWHDSVRIAVDADGVGLRLELLDRDVYRSLGTPLPPTPRSPDEVDRWRALLGEALALLVREQRGRAEAIAASLRTLAPTTRQEPFRPRSASGEEAFGGVLLSEPDDATQLAVTLVHESQHHKLGALLHMLTFAEKPPPNTPEIRYYAPWRDDPRPLGGLLQGVYAFAGITDFWRIHRRHTVAAEQTLAQFEFALWRRQTFGAAQVLAAHPYLTASGRNFTGGLLDTLRAWQDDAVPPEIDTWALAMAADHHALWRAHNVRVADPVRTAYAEAWRSGEPAPDAPTVETVVAAPDTSGFDSRAVLTRHRLGDPDEFARAGRRVAHIQPADIDLIAGKTADARAGYTRVLTHDLTNCRAWVGLGLTLDPGEPAARALLSRPELVIAVARETSPAEPLAVADWIGRGLPADLVPAAPNSSGWQVV